MQTQFHEQPQIPRIGERASRGWVHHVIALLNAAMGELDQEQAAHDAILQATSLLRRQAYPEAAEDDRGDAKERLLAWQARKVIEHIDRCITSRVLVADLCALVQRSEAHFSRSFRRTSGTRPMPSWSAAGSNWPLNTC